MIDQEKAEERLNQRNRVWNEIIESRRWKVQQIYGREAAEKYHFLTREKNFFLLYGHLPTNPSKDSYYEAQGIQAEVDSHHAEFWAFCDSQYPKERDAYFGRIEATRKAAQAWPEYQKQQKDRNQLNEYLRSQRAQSS
jgi:hypothetical protein